MLHICKLPGSGADSEHYEKSMEAKLQLVP